jgi:catechol 1,2-dioxygenase
MALELRAECERCGTLVLPDGEARICSYECTFCPACADAMESRCPNCGGELVPRPLRSPAGPSAAAEIAAAALASFDGCDDPRLRAVLRSLVRHLHAFAGDVGLTEREWETGIRFLTETGHITDEHRQEFILLSDTLGLSMLVDALAHRHAAGATESTVLGPFYAAGSPLRGYGESIAERPSGSPAWVHGLVHDTAGAPIEGAELDVWQNADDRLYAVQNPDAPEHHLRGRFLSREDGSYAFLAERPLDYTIPSDGPVGRMLAATGRHPWRPAHIHLIVRAPGHATLTTHIFDDESEFLRSDAVFAVKSSLARRFVPRSADDPARPTGVTGDWFSVENDLVLAREPGAAA